MLASPRVERLSGQYWEYEYQIAATTATVAPMAIHLGERTDLIVPGLVDVEIDRFDRYRRSGLVIQSYGHRNEFCLVGRGIIGEIDVRRTVGSDKGAAVVRNYRSRRHGNRISDGSSCGIGIAHGKRYRLRRTYGYGNGGETRGNRGDERGFRGVAHGRSYENAFVGKRLVREKSGNDRS